jgi:hypothetical protein
MYALKQIFSGLVASVAAVVGTSSGAAAGMADQARTLSFGERAATVRSQLEDLEKHSNPTNGHHSDASKIELVQWLNFPNFPNSFNNWLNRWNNYYR